MKNQKATKFDFQCQFHSKLQKFGLTTLKINIVKKQW